MQHDAEAVFVSGGSKGIGRAIALRFAARGADVFVNYRRDVQSAESTAELIAQAGGTAHLIPADMGNAADARGAMDAVRSQTEGLTHLVHCAVRALPGALMEADPKEVSAAVGVNGLGLLYAVQAAADLLGRRTSVTFLSSIGATRAVPNYGAVGISKALGESLCRYLAVELAPRGVRVNAVSAGPLDTEAFRAVINNPDQRLVDAGRRNPSGRNIDFDDVVNLVEFLGSPAASMIQGQVIMVDGGLSL